MIGAQRQTNEKHYKKASIYEPIGTLANAKISLDDRHLGLHNGIPGWQGGGAARLAAAKHPGDQ
jgi:hypothetical protein